MTGERGSARHRETDNSCTDDQDLHDSGVSAALPIVFPSASRHSPQRWCRSGAIAFYSFAVALSTPSDERAMNKCDEKSPSKLARL
jgi:hypothetical protein